MSKKILIGIGLVTFLLLSVPFIQVANSRALEPLTSEAVNEPSVSSPSVSTSGQVVASVYIDTSKVKKDRVITSLQLIKSFNSNNPKVVAAAQNVITAIQSDLIPCSILRLLIFLLNAGGFFLDLVIISRYEMRFGIDGFIDAIIDFLNGYITLQVLLGYLSLVGILVGVYLLADLLSIIYQLMCNGTQAANLAITATSAGGLQLQLQNGQTVIPVYNLA